MTNLHQGRTVLIAALTAASLSICSATAGAGWDAIDNAFNNAGQALERSQNITRQLKAGNSPKPVDGSPPAATPIAPPPSIVDAGASAVSQTRRTTVVGGPPCFHYQSDHGGYAKVYKNDCAQPLSLVPSDPKDSASCKPQHVDAGRAVAVSGHLMVCAGTVASCTCAGGG